MNAKESIELSRGNGSSMSLRILFAGTPDFSVPTLQALIESEYEVVGVYTQPDRPRGRGKKVQFTPVKTVAVEHNIPVFQPQTLRSEEAQAELAALKPDLMVVVAYGLILPQKVLDIPTYGCINIHASLLPRWRGAAPLHRAIEAGDRESGVGIMQMELGLDTGPIWAESSVPITPEMSTGELHDTLKVEGANLLLKTIPLIIKGEQRPTPQSEEGVTYAEKITRDEALIDWHRTAKTLQRQIHAFNPYPGAFTYLNGTLLKLFRVVVTERKSSHEAGTIFTEESRLFISTKDYDLEVLELQAAGKRRMESAQFLQGNLIEKEVLGKHE